MATHCKHCGHYYWVHSSNHTCRCQGWWSCNEQTRKLTNPDGYEWTADVFAECICHESTDSVRAMP